jgi:hypothetical protein
MNEKKVGQQLTTVGSAHHQKRQQSLGVVSSHQAPHNVNPTSQIAAAHMQNLMMKHNNFVQMSSANGNILSSSDVVLMNGQ